MVKKIVLVFILSIFVANSFAGYSGGGRSGFSSSGRSFSSGSYSRSSSLGRSGYNSGRSAKVYSTPVRTYSGSSRSYSGSNTVIHNNHYSHGGGWGFGGSGFFSGFLGGYLGGTMANHGTTVITSPPVVGNGQGALIENPGYVVPSHQPGGLIYTLMCILLFVVVIWAIILLYRFMFNTNSIKNRW